MSYMALLAASVLLPGDSHMSSGANETAMIFGSIFVVLLGTVIWIVYFRKKPQRRRHRRHPHNFAGNAPARAAATHEETVVEVKHRRVRRNQRRKRQQNPTLADIRGLPPVRTGNPQSGSPASF
jgi:hypothetical protein